MSIHSSIYHFNRLNIIAQYDNKEKFVLDLLKKSISIENKQFLWGFFDINEYQSTSFGLFYHGYLVKYESESEEEIANPDTHSIDDQSISNRVIAKSPFFLHVKSGLIIFKPILNLINPVSFRKKFVEILQKANDNLCIDAEIQTIQDQIKFQEEIKKFSKLKRVRIYLHPSNPNNSRLWKKIDNKLKELEASKYEEKIEIKDDGTGLLLVNDPEFQSKYYMAQDGYGKADISGFINNKIKNISTFTNPVTEKIQDDPDDIVKTIKLLNEKIKSIFERFTYED